MKSLKIVYALFTITFSTILLELLYTRVFSVVYISSFAFLMISLALFGYGLSGVMMSLTRLAQRPNAIRYLETALLGNALILPIVYKFTLTFTVDFLHLFNPISNIFLLILNLLFLILPYFLAGTSLVLIFSLYSKEIGKLYFIDLAGSALGGLAIVPLITTWGPSKVVSIVYLLLFLCWFILSHLPRKAKVAIFAAGILVFGALFHYSETLYPVVPRMVKRAYLLHQETKQFEYSRWSPINKIDVAPFIYDWKKIIWIDGGTMQSWLVQASRNIKEEGVIQEGFEAIPYRLGKKGSALIIGSAGGYEVLCGLTNGFKRIVAVEMDPEICHIVEREYAPYIGNLFQQRGVELVNDEGRSVLKRLDEKFDVIQMVNSHNTDSLLSGGLSIAETYIYTVESFKDYWSHMNDNGYISIVHWFGERLFSTAYQALREMKIPEPEKKLFIAQSKGGFNFFFLKKGNFTGEEIAKLTEFAKKYDVVFSPDRTMDNIYYRLASDRPEEVYRDSSVLMPPVRDNSPYINQPNKIGQFRFKNNYTQGMAKEVTKWSLIYSNSVYLSILSLSLLFSFFFIYLPLRRRRLSSGANHKAILYFFLIGLCYIMVEIIFIKIFQLFLGNPAYSISVIVFSLLLSSGLGSLFSGRIAKLLGRRALFTGALVIALFLTLYAFFLFPLVSSLIFLPLVFRFLTAFVMIAVVGFFMGTFFPTGIRHLGETDTTLIGWAWGSNSFATVIGSVLGVILALNYSFTVVLLVCALGYFSAGALFHFTMNRRESAA